MKSFPTLVQSAGGNLQRGSASTMPRVLNGIVAVCPDLGIGNNGNLPWHPVRLRWVTAVMQKRRGACKIMIFLAACSVLRIRPVISGH